MSPQTNNSEPYAGAVLSIDLGAIQANYELLQKRFSGGTVGAVLKADAYGLGVGKVAPALARAGARVFFVALPEEGIRLRQILNDTGESAFIQAQIHVLGGLMKDAEEAYDASRLIPVLGSLDEIHDWKNFCHRIDAALPCDIHIDTGMLRLGLPPDELDTLAREPARINGLDIVTVISHLACADEPKHLKNAEQLAAFMRAREILPMGRASLANSSGIFLGADYHFDLARPGVAIYGLGPTLGEPNPMAQVVRLQGKIAQVRDVDSFQTVGYGASHRIQGAGRIATVLAGYADGYLRSLSNNGTGYVGNIPVPVVGHVSMDLITFDVSEVPRHLTTPGNMIDLIGPHNPVEQIAAEAGTIGYEILTSLGNRYRRVYIGE